MQYHYILLIFNTQECDQLNAIWIFPSIKALIQRTKGVIRYSDVGKKTRTYKTAKSFFRILKVSQRNINKYLKL